MKQITFMILFLLSVSISIQEQLLKNNKDTVLNYFKNHVTNNYANKSKNLQNSNELSNLEKNYQKSFRFQQKPINKNKKKKSKGGKKKKMRIRRRKTYKDPVQVLKEGWLRISSISFRHPGKFPSITLPDWEEMRIPVNKENFRINELYDQSDSGEDMPPTKYDFWFRVSGKNLYYSQKKDDLNVLGSISSINIVGSTSDRSKGSKNCFTIKNKEKRSWKLCGQDILDKLEWICQLKTMLGHIKIRECGLADLLRKRGKGKNGKYNLGEIGGDEVSRKPTVLVRKVETPIILIPLPSKQCNEEWDYSNKGQDWNCECSEGKEQSPINLPPKEHAIISPIKPIFSFNEVSTKTEISTKDGQHKTDKILQIKNKNHALRIKHNYFGKTITLDGALYTAEEIVFHSPAEHQIDGKYFDMEMQIIHYGKSSGDIAKQLVLSFVFERKAGVYNKFIDDLDFFNLPNLNTKKRPILNSLFIPKIFYNSDYEEVAVMKPFSFYTYQGSLTQPPCTERTIHYVASKPIKLGSSALDMFQEAIRIPDKITSTGDVISFPNPNENNRNIQPLNGRAVFYYESKRFCGRDKDIKGVIDGSSKRRRRSKGHYEKVLKKMNEYYYVSGPIPSGLPGAYVVSAKEAQGLVDRDK